LFLSELDVVRRLKAQILQLGGKIFHSFLTEEIVGRLKLNLS